MLAEEVAYVLGVDTHTDSHAIAIVETGRQKVEGSVSIPATRRGYRQALRLARLRAPGQRLWALEGTGSYGSGLARFLDSRGERVLEVERPRREGSRGRLKSDPLDAERAARAALFGGSGGQPRGSVPKRKPCEPSWSPARARSRPRERRATSSERSS